MKVTELFKYAANLEGASKNTRFCANAFKARLLFASAKLYDFHSLA